MKRKLLTLAGGALLLAASVAAVSTSGTANSPGSHDLAVNAAGTHLAPAGGNFTLREARAFDDFRVYYAGASVAGQPLTAILRRQDLPYPGEPIQPNTVAFVYGDCLPEADTGCAPPLEVKTWPACRRSPAAYDLPPDEKLTLRGVPAFFYEDATRLELSTGRVTVVLYGSGRSELLEAAARLEPVNASALTADGSEASPFHAVAADESVPGPLPAPAPGALAGALACGSEE